MIAITVTLSLCPTSFLPLIFTQMNSRYAMLGIKLYLANVQGDAFTLFVSAEQLAWQQSHITRVYKVCGGHLTARQTEHVHGPKNDGGEFVS